MFNYWKGLYQQAREQAALISKEYTNLIKISYEAYREFWQHIHMQDEEIARLQKALWECKHKTIIADTLSLTLQFEDCTVSNIVTKKQNTMAVTLPTKKFVIATIKGLRAVDKVEGLITDIELASTDSTVLLVEPVLGTDGVTPVANQRKVTTLKEGSATLSFSAKNSAGSLLSGSEDWTVTVSDGQAPVIADSLNISYGDPQDVPVV